jgi:hypothetical protein
MSNDLSNSLSEPGSGVLILPQPDKAIQSGSRRDTPPYNQPPQVGDPYKEIYERVYTGIEL